MLSNKITDNRYYGAILDLLHVFTMLLASLINTSDRACSCMHGPGSLPS